MADAPGVGRPRMYSVPTMKATGLHPKQHEWLKEEARRRGITYAAVLRQVVWDAMRTAGLDVDAMH